MNSNFIFHHIGVATRSIEKTTNVYINLGYTASEIMVEPSQNVKIRFLSKEGSPLLEIIEPLSEESPVSKMVMKSGATPYHTCYEVEDINKGIEELEELNFRQLFEPLVSNAMDEGLFCYLFSVDTGLVELYERKK
jgi:methylmalonyl-CoA/ethylmalonyl-CoA epimerase